MSFPKMIVVSMFFLFSLLSFSNYEFVYAQGSVPAEFRPGKVQARVVPLTKDNFQDAITDPANPFWLLKFYAPWCGHCKRLEPVLEMVASRVIGKMAIGKIDCTNEKKLCSDHKVRGYPTLMYSVDGNVETYGGSRDEKEFISFAEKMTRPPVQIIQPTTAENPDVSIVEKKVKEWIQSTDLGVGYIAWIPNIEPTTISTAVNVNNHDGIVQNIIVSSKFLQIFSQVAKIKILEGQFAFLLSSASFPDEIAHDNKAYIVRIENSGVKPIFFWDNTDSSDNTKEELLEFVSKNSLPLVNHLSNSNFGKVSRAGKPLVLGVLDGKNQNELQLMKDTLTKYALSTMSDEFEGNANIRSKYNYGYMDGKKYSDYFSRFDISSNQLPVIFALDLPNEKYWYNYSYYENNGKAENNIYQSLNKFLNDIENGVIKEKKVEGQKGLQKYLAMLSDPYVAVPILIFFVVAIIGICFLLFPDDGFDDDEYDIPNDDDEDSDQEIKESDETKKDK